MEPTKKLMSRCELLKLLESLESGVPSTAEHRKLAEALERFALELARTSRREGSKIELLRMYATLRRAFLRLKNAQDFSGHRERYVEAALSCLETEERLLLLQIRYPGIDAGGSGGKSPLMWSAAYTPTDLMELISALHAADAIRKTNGAPVELRTLIRAFEQFLNVTIKYPDRCRNATINRSLRLTKFLDLLRYALTELSRR